MNFPPLPTQTEVWDLRNNLWRNGHRPVSVYTNDKRPFGNNWTERARQNPPDATATPPHDAALNTGILCDGLRIIDIDVDDSVIANQIAALAVEIFGEAPVRYRDDSPRRALERNPIRLHRILRTGSSLCILLG